MILSILSRYGKCLIFKNLKIILEIVKNDDFLSIIDCILLKSILRLFTALFLFEQKNISSNLNVK